MKKFIKDNLCFVVIIGIVIIIVLGLSIWGITKLVSSGDKKLNNNDNSEVNENKPSGKYDSINDAKDLVDSNTIERLYNYILGIGYNSGSEGAFIYTSELYKDYLVTLDDLSDEAIIRAGISQVVICGSEYESEDISYTVIEEKIKETFGKLPNVKLDTYINMTASGGYGCSKDKCVPIGGSYCTTLPLKNDKELISVAADFNDSNTLYLYDENESGLMYRHTFKKQNDNYYWYSSEPLGK